MASCCSSSGSCTRKAYQHCATATARAFRTRKRINRLSSESTIKRSFQTAALCHQQIQLILHPLSDSSMLSLPFTSSKFHTGVPKGGRHSDDDDSIPYRLKVSFEIPEKMVSTNKLINQPRGSFALESWFEAEEALPFWGVQRTPESVQLSFALLETVLEEDQYQNCNQQPKKREEENDQQMQDNNIPNNKSWLNVDLLNRLVNNWRVVSWNEDIPPLSSGQTSSSLRLKVASDVSSTSTDAATDINPSISRFSFTPEDMVGRMMYYHERLGFTPSEKTFFLILEAAITNQDLSPSTLPDFANDLLEKCSYLYKETGRSDCRPRRDLYNQVLRTWARSGRSDAASSAEVLMESMLEQRIPINRRTYNRVIYCWSLQGSTEGAVRAQELLQRMWSEYEAGDTNVQPCPLTFSSVISAWASSTSPQAAVKARELLTWMHKLRDQQKLARISRQAEQKFYRETMNGTMLCYCNIVANCQSKKAMNTAIQEALQMLKHLETVENYEADFMCYSMLIQGCATVGKPLEAERLLKEMYDSYMADPEKNHRLKPANGIITTVISAWAKSNNPDKYERAKVIFNSFQGLYEREGDSNFRATRLQQLQDDDCDTNEDFFDKIKIAGVTNDENERFRPNTATYNALLDCLANTKKGFPATKATKILAEMKASKDPDVKPNRITYTTVMNCWARGGFADETKKLFDEMLEDYLGGNISAQPDLHTFNTVLASLASSNYKGSPYEAEALLTKMKNLRSSASFSDERLGLSKIRPDVYSYASVISCWATARKEKRSVAAERAEALLREMQKPNSSVRPNEVCYNSVMNSWARASQPARVEAILKDMYNDYMNNGNVNAKPTSTSFNILLKALALSKHPAAPAYAEEILQRMQEWKQIAPNIISYTTVMLCHSLAKQPGAPQRSEAILKHIQALYKAGELDQGPNKKTYQTLRRAWLDSNEPNKKERAAAIQKEIKERFGE